jgi:hypothetical protein
MELEVASLPDQDRVKRHFDAYRKKFVTLFPKPPLGRLKNPGYYKVLKLTQVSFRWPIINGLFSLG